MAEESSPAPPGLELIRADGSVDHEAFRAAWRDLEEALALAGEKPGPGCSVAGTIRRLVAERDEALARRDTLQANLDGTVRGLLSKREAKDCGRA